MKQRLSVFLLVCMMLASLCPRALATETAVTPVRTIVRPDVTFSDIQGHKNQAAIEWLAAYGMIDGMGKDIFAPEAHMTRAQFAKIIVCALGLMPEYRGTFSDVEEASWYAGYVDTAAAYGIVNGVGQGRFDPEGLITRQEAVTMLARTAQQCGLDTTVTEEAYTAFETRPDAAEVSEYARSAMAYCLMAGIVDGEEALAPTRAILRCEVAQMLYCLLVQTELFE